MKTLHLLLMICAISFNSVAEYLKCFPGTEGDLSTSKESELSITIDYSATRQRMESFGASDCWTCQHVGNWPDEKKNAIADLLFETGLDENNNPKGIGLSLWRFNIGAGSSRKENIVNEWRKADTFLSEDFKSYDWSRCPGQRWFLQAAKKRGVTDFLAFCNSPPINMTKNGKAFCDANDGSTNLADDKFDDFAEYIATILKHFRDEEGIDFKYISPFNEPQWDWQSNKQEGCRYSNKDIAKGVKILYDKLKSKKLNTEIIIGEAGNIDYLYDMNAVSGLQIDSFFDIASSFYIADKLASAINAHSYSTDTPSRGLVKKRKRLRDKLNQYPKLEYHQSEYCHLNDWGRPRDLGMDPALQMARVIHHDLTIAEAVSWQWWLGVSCYSYNDGLVYVSKRKKNGTYRDSKSLWVMGNFSRFIRPGMYRISLSRSDNATPEDTQEDLMISAYKNTDEKKIVVVCVNYSEKDKIIKLRCDNLPKDMSVQSWIPYVTSREYDLKPFKTIGHNSNISIPARLVITFINYNQKEKPAAKADNN